MSMEKMIQIQKLKKMYHGCPAVREISFQVNKGQLFALLGPNGAGKSTTINILCTAISSDGGNVVIDGLTLGRQDWEIRSRIGVVFQNGVLDDLLTVRQNLFTRGSFYGMHGKSLQSRMIEIAEMTGITDILARPYGQLSGGQRRRCDIARALLHQPKILFLDEPTTGLDPEMRSAVWQTVRKIQNQTGTTIILTTHYMEEAALADYIVIMKNGKIAAKGSPSALKNNFSQDRLVLQSNNVPALQSILCQNRIAFQKYEDATEISLSQTLQALPLLKLCRGYYTGFEVLQGSMDDAYLSVIEEKKNHA